MSGPRALRLSLLCGADCRQLVAQAHVPYPLWVVEAWCVRCGAENTYRGGAHAVEAVLGHARDEHVVRTGLLCWHDGCHEVVGRIHIPAPTWTLGLWCRRCRGETRYAGTPVGIEFAIGPILSRPPPEVIPADAAAPHAREPVVVRRRGG